MTDDAGDNPVGRAGRRLRWDGGRGRGTNGAAPGTSGAGRPARFVAAVLGLLVLVSAVNVMTALDDARRRGVVLPVSLPITLEATSALATLIAVAVIAVALRLAPPGRGPPWRTIAIHLGGSLAFSGAHVGLMTLLRTLAFGAVGRRYAVSLADLPYEYRKDLVSYLVIGGLFWLLGRTAAPVRPPEPAPAVFDIRSGAVILRAPVREILSARAAGNYVEFALEDGRRPLMRASMAGIEAALAPHGFVRTHRSWLVNAGRVRALAAAGSGDWRLDLGGGLTAPLSRRYPAALTRLKGADRP